MNKGFSCSVGLLLAVTVPALAAQAMLAVESVNGSASISRDNQTLVAASGIELRAGDLLFTGADAQLALQLNRYGQVDLGASTQLMVEKLPFSSFASDLNTVLEMRGGYVHLVWKHPGSAEKWLLQVDFGDERVSLNSGEYFFEKNGEARKLCVGSGAAVLSGGPVLDAAACYTIATGAAPQKLARSSTDFIAMRDAGAIQMPAQAAPLKIVPPPASVAPAAAVPAPPPPVPLAASPAPKPAPPPAAAKRAAAPAPAVAAEKPAPEAAPESPVQVIASGSVPVFVPVPGVPEAEPAAAPAKSAAKPPAVSWTLNVTSESDAKSAKEAILRLRAAGYQPTVETAQVKGREWYRVQITGIGSAAHAQELAGEIKAKLGYKDIWVAKKK